jgi:pimeloyl-[acyl-carrier protein] methyl ester esterase
MTGTRRILISGWGTGNDVWDGLNLQPSSPAGDIRLPWYDCLGDTPDDNALLRVLGDADGDKYILVGWSLGGLIALSAALQFPDAVAGLVLISATARMTAIDETPGADPRMLRAMRAKLRRDAAPVVRAFAELCVAPEQDDDFCDTFTQSASDIEPAALDAGLAYLQETDLRDRLSEIATPTLVIHGELDAVVPLGCASYLCEHIAGATLDVIPDGNHAMWPAQSSARESRLDEPLARKIERFTHAVVL